MKKLMTLFTLIMKITKQIDSNIMLQKQQRMTLRILLNKLREKSAQNSPTRLDHSYQQNDETQDRLINENIDKEKLHIRFNVDQNEIFDQQQNDSINYPTADFVPNPNFKNSKENKLASKKQKDDNIKSFNHTDRNNNFDKEVMRDSDGLIIINSKNKQSPSMRFFESIGLGSSARDEYNHSNIKQNKRKEKSVFARHDISFTVVPNNNKFLNMKLSK